MIKSVEKRRRRVAGKVVETRSYYLRYKLDWMPVDKWRSLGTTDKQCADKRATEFFQEIQQEQDGILDAKPTRESARTPLRQHLKDFIADMERRGKAGRGGRDGRLLGGRVGRLLDACGWNLPASVSADSFVRWRSQQTDVLGARTLNHYLEGIVCLLNWMERSGRIKSNPLRHVDKVDERVDVRRRRQALSDEKLGRLVRGSGPRGIVYFTAARSGLRSDELRQLTWADVELDTQPPRVRVRVETAKNKREQFVDLVPEIVEALREYRGASWKASANVFPKGIPRACRMEKDCERNSIAYCDADGRYADFHALRHTFGTWLQRNQVAPREIMRLMRHSDYRLTMNTYTDERQLGGYEVLKNLPRLDAGYTQIRAQISGAEGQNESRAVAPVKPEELTQHLATDAVCRVLSHVVAVKEVERAKGFEPSIPTFARNTSLS